MMMALLELSAKASCRPVGAACENRPGGSTIIHVHHKLVMSDVARGHVTADEFTLTAAGAAGN